MNYTPLSLLEDSNINVPLQKGFIGAEWFNAEETSCTNNSRTLIKIYEDTLYTEDNTYGMIATHVIETIINNYFIHILNYTYMGTATRPRCSPLWRRMIATHVI